MLKNLEAIKYNYKVEILKNKREEKALYKLLVTKMHQ